MVSRKKTSKTAAPKPEPKPKAPLVPVLNCNGRLLGNCRIDASGPYFSRQIIHESGERVVETFRFAALYGTEAGVGKPAVKLNPGQSPYWLPGFEIA